MSRAVEVSVVCFSWRSKIEAADSIHLWFNHIVFKDATWIFQERSLKEVGFTTLNIMQTKRPVSSTAATSGWQVKMCIPLPVAKRLGSVLLAVTGCCTKNLLVIALIASRSLHSPIVSMENPHLLTNICQRLSDWQLILKKCDPNRKWRSLLYKLKVAPLDAKLLQLNGLS